MKKIGIILLAAVLALGVIGVGYAAWSQALAFTSNVATGNLAATITSGALASNATYATIVKSASSTNTNLIITIGNAAPGNVFTVPWTITNTGTIPVNAVAPTPVITVNSGAGAAVGNLVVAGAPGAITNLASLATVTGSLTITVQASTPNDVGGCSYTVSIPMTITQ
jgi:hypothetical protein